MIRLTKIADYGIVLMTAFASDREGAFRTTRDLALSTGIPVPTVSKVLKALARAGLLLSHRGVTGGYGLARRPSEVSVAQVIAALEGPIALTECLTEGAHTCEIESCCPVRSHWDRINGVVRRALEGLSLAEMAHPLFPVGAGRGPS